MRSVTPLEPCAIVHKSPKTTAAVGGCYNAVEIDVTATNVGSYMLPTNIVNSSACLEVICRHQGCRVIVETGFGVILADP